MQSRRCRAAGFHARPLPRERRRAAPPPAHLRYIRQMSEGSKPKKKAWLPLWARKGLLGISGWMKKTAGSIEGFAEPGEVTLAIKSNEESGSLSGPDVGVTALTSPVEGKPVGKSSQDPPASAEPKLPRPPDPKARRPSANRERLSAEDGATSTRIAYITDIEGNWECAPHRHPLPTPALRTPAPLRPQPRAPLPPRPRRTSHHAPAMHLPCSHPYHAPTLHRPCTCHAPALHLPAPSACSPAARVSASLGGMLFELALTLALALTSPNPNPSPIQVLRAVRQPLGGALLHRWQPYLRSRPVGR